MMVCGQNVLPVNSLPIFFLSCGGTWGGEGGMGLVDGMFFSMFIYYELLAMFFFCLLILVLFVFCFFCFSL